MCVCVWTIWKDVKLLTMQGGSESHSIHCPTKTVVWDCDIGTDHPDVPAIFQFANFHFVVNGNRLSQEPACRFSVASWPSSELRCKQVLIYCTVFAIWFTADYVRWNSWFQVSIHCTVFAIWFTADFVRWNSCFLQGQRKNSSTLVFSPSHPIFPVRL